MLKEEENTYWICRNTQRCILKGFLAHFQQHTFGNMYKLLAIYDMGVNGILKRICYRFAQKLATKVIDENDKTGRNVDGKFPTRNGIC